MEGSHKNNIFIVIFLSGILFSLVVLYGCVAGGPALLKNPLRTEGEREILIARDIGGGLGFSLIRWCGNKALLIYGDEFGTQWVDLKGNRVTVSTKGTDYPVDCTPDGEWVIYRDRKSARQYRDRLGRIPEDMVDEGPGWHGTVVDLYRYEVATGTRHKFAVVRDDSGSLVSPDGSKVLLGNSHERTIEMPEPEWEKLWLSNAWFYDNTLWFADSSGIVTRIWGDGSALGVEFFGDGGWAKEFSLEELSGGKRPGVSITFEAVDKENRIYLTLSETPLEAKRWGWTRHRFLQCVIRNRKIACKELGRLDEHGRRITTLILLPDREVIFKREGDRCIRRLILRKTDAQCVVDTRYGEARYRAVELIDVSPDGRWMAFLRSKTPPKQSGRFYVYHLDLFVKEISRD